MSERIELTGLMRLVHDAGNWLWQLFFALHLVLLGTLMTRSGLYSRLLGAVLMAGCIGYLVDSVQMFALPSAAPLAAVSIALLQIVTLSKLGFALWLLLRGPRTASMKQGVGCLVIAADQWAAAVTVRRAT